MADETSLSEEHPPIGARDLIPSRAAGEGMQAFSAPQGLREASQAPEGVPEAAQAPSSPPPISPSHACERFHKTGGRRPVSIVSIARHPQ